MDVVGNPGEIYLAPDNSGFTVFYNDHNGVHKLIVRENGQGNLFTCSSKTVDSDWIKVDLIKEKPIPVGTVWTTNEENPIYVWIKTERKMVAIRLDSGKDCTGLSPDKLEKADRVIRLNNKD